MDQLLTKNGYDFFEVASAFQKSIRRGLEKEAMFWAVELYESGYQKYAWKRMVIMASEDVGLGTPGCITAIMALKQSYDFLFALRERSLPEKLPFTQAVLTLVICRKSRYVDLAISTYWNRHKTQPMAIPDYAYDMHTRKGKSMGRGLDHFYKEASRINNANKMPGEEEMERLALQADKGIPADYRENISCTEEEGVNNLQNRLFDDTK
jgi:replication-associated recombination protein RarA